MVGNEEIVIEIERSDDVVRLEGGDVFRTVHNGRLIIVPTAHCINTIQNETNANIERVLEVRRGRKC